MVESPEKPGRSGSGAARSALLWGAGSSLVRDVVQFASMLVLVRILSPEQYGQAAFAQALFGVLAIFSFTAFLQHALQFRDPDHVDWDMHFAAGLVVNGALFIVVLAIAATLWNTEKYSAAAIPLAVLAIGLLVEIPGAIQSRYLECHHQWARFRTLVIAGTLLGVVVGISVALLGGGVLALVVQAPCLMLPSALDLFRSDRIRPRGFGNWADYRDAFRFGINRIAAGLTQRSRAAVENQRLVALHDFAIAGIFSRATGLANLLSGRFGQLAVQSLYPVVTRAEAGSARFRRSAELVFRGASWVAIPSGVFLAASADAAVRLVYGSQWIEAIGLIPLACASVVAASIASVLTTLLLANNNARISLGLDVVHGAVAILLAILVLPIGIEAFLGALALLGALMAGLAFTCLNLQRGIDGGAILVALLPPALASGLAVLGLEGVHFLMGGALQTSVSILLVNAVFFAAVVMFMFRAIFPGLLEEMLAFAPRTDMLRKLLFYSAVY